MTTIRLPITRYYTDANGTDRDHVRIDGYIDLTPEHIAQILGDLPGRLAQCEKRIREHHDHGDRIAALEAWQQEQVALAHSMMAMAREKFPEAHAKMASLVQQQQDAKPPGAIAGGDPSLCLIHGTEQQDAKPCAHSYGGHLTAHRCPKCNERLTDCDPATKLPMSQDAAKPDADEAGDETAPAMLGRIASGQIAALNAQVKVLQGALAAAREAGRNAQQGWDVLTTDHRVLAEANDKAQDQIAALRRENEALRADLDTTRDGRRVENERANTAVAERDRLAARVAELERQPDPWILAKERDKALAELAAERADRGRLDKKWTALCDKNNDENAKLKAGLAAATERAEEGRDKLAGLLRAGRDLVNATQNHHFLDCRDAPTDDCPTCRLIKDIDAALAGVRGGK